jgi:hypothetical protein
MAIVPQMGKGDCMNEGTMLDRFGELDIGLRRSQAEAQRAVAALHGAPAEDDWADDGWADNEWIQDGAEETGPRGAAGVELAGASPGSSDGDWIAITGARN